ncbi:MAG: DUF188 domain-containing protein [Treponema sp.]|jgi:uncharacterized protein YaiI (UPF0178 family)|nr:DUF188 domain-containing protein [Treponema sp.]
MKILVDADSCPKLARELVLRRAAKLKIRIIFAANHAIPVWTEEEPDKPVAEMEICPNTDNSADDRLVELAEKGDLALTRDVPLAKRLVEKDTFVLDDRGRVFTKNNINELLSLRNFTVGLADNGLEFERTANYSKKDFKTFADSLDRLLTKMLKYPLQDTVPLSV